MRINGKTKLLLVLVISIALMSSIYFLLNKDKGYKEIPYNSFLNQVERELVEEVELSDLSKVKGKLKDGTNFITDNPRTENFKIYARRNSAAVKPVDRTGHSSD